MQHYQQVHGNIIETLKYYDASAAASYMSRAVRDNPVPENDIYCATKAGLASLTKSLAKKYAPAIQVNAVAPASLFHSDYSDDEREELLKSKLLLEKEGSAQSVYIAIQYLLNQHFTTGTVLNVDGGRSIL